MPMILQTMISREDLRLNPNVLYIFGDNEQRWGFGGQAKEMRGEPNAVGIATKKSPRDFWREDDNVRQCNIIMDDMRRLFTAAAQGRTIVMPVDGIGTGLAALEFHAPSTFRFLQDRLVELKTLANKE